MLLTEVQSLDIISVNIWQILISLINLLLLFLIIKKFLFKPVQNMLAKRKASIDADYEEAAEMKKAAAESEKAWNIKLEGAQAASDAIIDEAKRSAKHRSDEIIAAANDKAAGIIRRAEMMRSLKRKRRRRLSGTRSLMFPPCSPKRCSPVRSTRKITESLSLHSSTV